MTPPTILVVDDDTAIREVMRITLNLEGYRTLTVDNGADAFRLLAEEPVQLMISDVIMPETDGVELMRDVRKRYPEVKIIGMSGGGSHITAALCLRLAGQLGASAILSKPFTREELLATVAKALK